MLARGLGRAILHLQTHDAIPYRDTILHACTHFVGYDVQTDPSRARYNFDLITQGGDRDWYLPRLYHAFATGEDVEMPIQLFNLMGFLAQDGNTLARMMMYDNFAEDAPELDTTGADVLVDLDGLAGYVFVARQWIKHPLPEDDQWEEDVLLDTVEERFGADAVTAALAATMDENVNEGADLSVYLAQVRERRRLDKANQPKRPQFPVPDYETVRGIVDKPLGRSGQYLLRRAGRFADDALLSRVAGELDAETDPARVLHLLYFFGWAVFPLPPHRLLALAQSGDQDTAFAARAALAHVTHPDVRAFALAQMDTGNVRYLVDMLQMNPAEEDYALMAALTQRPLSADEFHHAGMSILDYVKTHPSPQAVPALLGVYENGLCAFCRSSVVDSLAALTPLPQAIEREIAWDASPDTRTYAAFFGSPNSDGQGLA